MDVLTVYISDGEKPQVEEYLNWKIFNEEFNFGFEYPHNDTCDQLKVAIDSAQSADEQCQLQTELAKHHKKASQCYCLHSDSTHANGDPKFLVIAFDQDQNLPVPTQLYVLS